MSKRDLPLFRHRHEPAEPVALDSVNAALDQIEADARHVIEAGGEAALRARLARLLGDDVQSIARSRAGRRRRTPGRATP